MVKKVLPTTETIKYHSKVSYKHPDENISIMEPKNLIFLAVQPILIKSEVKFKQVACGGYHTLALA